MSVWLVIWSKSDDVLRGWLWVQEPDGRGEETPPESLCFCHQAAEALTRWQPSEKTVTRVIWVFDDFVSSASASPLYSQACGHPCCLCTFSYPNSSFQSTLHLICFDTALCKQPHLSVMTLCDLPSLWRVSMFVFWIIAKSAVFPIIVVSKNKRYPEFLL